MGKGESARRSERGSHPIVGGDGSKVAGVEIVQLTNEKVNVVRRKGIVLLKVIKSDERESGWEIPPKNMNGGARVLGGANNIHHWGVEREGWRNVNLNYNQGVVMHLRAPLKVVERTNKKGGSSKTGV